jgi:predicted ATPase
MSHLTYFKIQNFKCFDEIEVKEFGQYNLIVGDNNVGKTALMEAMMVDEDGWKTLGNYYHLLVHRGITEHKEGTKPYFLYLVKEGKNELICNFVLSESIPLAKGIDSEELRFGFEFENLTTDTIKLTTKPTTSNKKLFLNGDTERHFDEIPYIKTYYSESLPFVGIKSLDGKELGEKFTKAWKNDLEILERIVEDMKSVIPNIKDVRIGENELLCVSIAGDKKLKPLGSLGFGSNRFVEILIALFRFQGERLFIDEIDTGIHYSRLRDFLRTILTLADELNVQLFMTTHSKECEEAFAEVLNEKSELKPDFQLIRMMRKGDGSIKASVHKAESFLDGVDTGYEFRNSN